jgi:2-C-methyl-D-erythritol 4-phosphate cytidylyltransferase
MRVFVIIPAAGLGTRMSAAAKKARASQQVQSKQFTELAGVPILIRTLRKFASCVPVTEILLALRKKEAEQFRARLEREKLKKPVTIVEGGDSRQQSVENALGKIQGSDDDVVLVHDAVRPFVDPELIVAVMNEAKNSGAAIAGVPAVDTIKQVERTAQGALIKATIPRERVVMAQTPQGFRLGILRKAFSEALADGFTGTDEASLVERMGNDVAVVMGSARNIKITTPADLQLAEFYLEQEGGHRGTLAG